VKENMTFREVFDSLGIGDFPERIFNSNSHGELFHLHDYVQLLKWAEADGGKLLPHFREMFLACVDFAEKNWSRPESVFQHMPKMIQSFLLAHAEDSA